MRYLTIFLLSASLWAQSSFGGYSGGGCSSNPTCTLSVTKNTSIQATFNGPVNPISQFTTENTSASPSFAGMSNTSDVGAQTVIVNPVPGNVSTVDLHPLLPAGTKIYTHSTDWFTTPGTGDHTQALYNSNDANQVAAQDNDMIARHFDARLLDSYSQFNLTTDGAAQKIRDDLAARCTSAQNCPLQFAIVEDQGAVTHAQGGRAACAVTNEGCIQSALLADVCYYNSAYFGSNAYTKVNPVSNAWQTATDPLIGFFPPSDTSAWNTAVAAIKSLVSVSGWAASNCPVGQQQDNGPLRSFDSNTTNVAESQYNGGSSWIGTSPWSTTNQFLIDGPTGNYHESLYQSCNANSGQICIGSAKKGFNDFPSPPFASWGTNRVVAQECGQTWAQSIAKMKSTFTGSNGGIDLVTWNDYEEGTEIETGIDNCGVMGGVSLGGNVISWNMSTKDSVYAPLANGLVANGTIDHFAIIRCSLSDTNCVDALDVSPQTSSQDLLNVVPTGAWHIWVQMVGINSIINRMVPAPVTYTHP